MAEILDIISQNTQSTVVAEYVREERERETGYQSESDLENELIVSILDRFEVLTTDLQSSLRVEIEARRKQYEYYREQLLNFKRIS